MKTLEDAWRWYQEAKAQIGLIRRIAARHWEELPWDGTLGKDDRFKELDRRKLAVDTQFTLDQMDDLAVLVLFSVFESLVRDLVAAEIKREVSEKSVTHSVLLHAIQDLVHQVEEGSFFRVLGPFKVLDQDLVEKVNQVRQYRNWVAHGRRGIKPSAVNPTVAYERLSQFWNLLNSQSTGVHAVDSP